MSETEILNELRKLAGKYESKGVRVWGKTATGEIVEVRVTSDGKLVWASG